MLSGGWTYVLQSEQEPAETEQAQGDGAKPRRSETESAAAHRD
jgi:hypothetical protein